MDGMPLAQAPALLKLLANDLRWQLVQALVSSDLRVQELVDRVHKPINLVSYHLRLLRDAELVHERRSSADARDVYYALDLERLHASYQASAGALHPALIAGAAAGRSAAPAGVGELPLRVLFLCTHNRARSQMAEGLLRHLGGHAVEAASAGVQPGPLHPLAVAALADLGVDIAGQQSKHLDAVLGQPFDRVITVCDQVREQCPAFPGVAAPIHWSIADPIAATEAASEDGSGSGTEVVPALHRTIFTRTAQDLATRIRYFLLAEGRVGSNSPVLGNPG